MLRRAPVACALSVSLLLQSLFSFAAPLESTVKSPRLSYGSGFVPQWGGFSAAQGLAASAGSLSMPSLGLAPALGGGWAPLNPMPSLLAQSAAAVAGAAPLYHVENTRAAVALDALVPEFLRPANSDLAASSSRMLGLASASDGAAAVRAALRTSSPLAAKATLDWLYEDQATVAPAVLDDASARGKTVLLVGTKPSILKEARRVADELGLNLVLLERPESREQSLGIIPDSHFIPAPIDRTDDASLDAIVEQVARRVPEIHAVPPFLSQYTELISKIVDRMNAAGISSQAREAAEKKIIARSKFNTLDGTPVPFREVQSAREAGQAYRELGGGRFVMKPIYGDLGRLVVVGIDSEDMAERIYREIDAELLAFSLVRAVKPGPTSNGIYEYPGIMMEGMLERKPGTYEAAVDLIMQHGRLAFAIVSDTLPIGPRLDFPGGSLVFPSQQGEEFERAAIARAAKAARVLGIENGNARVDVMMTAEGARVIEVNPRMGSALVWICVRLVTGISLIEQGIRALLNLRVDPGPRPTKVLDYRFMAPQFTGTLEDVEGLEEAAKVAGIELVRMTSPIGDAVFAAEESLFDEMGEIIGLAPSYEEVKASILASLGKIRIWIRGEDGVLVPQQASFLHEAASHQK